MKGDEYTDSNIETAVSKYTLSDIDFQKLDLTDDFMFRHCMPYKEKLKPLLEELWSKEIGDIVYVAHDHRIQTIKKYRSVICDIYIRDSKGDIYILEMKKYLLSDYQYL